MSAYAYSEELPSGWDTTCTEDNALFHSLEWQALLEKSFGCRSIYAWDADGKKGASVTVFRAGPFEIGYLGFPAGGAIGDSHLDYERLLPGKDNSKNVLPICIRIPVSAFSGPPDLPFGFEINPETAITDLQNWSLASVSKNLRRDIKKALRADLLVEDAAGKSDATDLFRIYEATVKKHGGALRYNSDYFAALIELSTKRHGLRVLVARFEDKTAGFAVVGSHKRTSYYLHGGTEVAYRQYSPSDLLLDKAIHRAQQDGDKCFNLMASPGNQPTLVRYKEKWGAETRQLKTYTVAVRSTYQLFRLVEKAYRLLR